MKFVLTAGGTAGHINPALALAEELTNRGHEVVFAGTPNRLESKLVPDADYKFVSFSSTGLVLLYDANYEGGEKEYDTRSYLPNEQAMINKTYTRPGYKLAKTKK